MHAKGKCQKGTQRFQWPPPKQRVIQSSPIQPLEQRKRANFNDGVQTTFSPIFPNSCNSNQQI
jgi:hypothetical protein